MKALRTLIAFAAFALSATNGARAEEVPAIDEILAHARAASGSERRPEAERELWSARVGGLEGTLELQRRGSDSTTTTEIGPFHTAHGSAHGQHWHQNENGETVLDRSEPSQVERTVAQTVARVREPLDAWQIVTTFASGHVLRAYYDARTYLLLRTERSVAGRTTRTTFDDFRIDARGRTRPWHYWGGDDRGENEFDYRLLRDDPIAEADADVGVPRDRRTLVEFPAGSDVVRLPARIDDGRIYVRLQIAGRGLDFLLDTGAAALTIDDAVARKLGLTAYGRAAQTVAGRVESSRVIVPYVAVGALTMRDVVMRALPLELQESRDTRVVGLLGFDFLDAVALKLDYAAGTVDAVRPSAFIPPAAATPLEVRLNTGAPVARATLGSASGDDFILDTGAAFSYVVFQRFARAHPEAVAPAGDGRPQYGTGVGGTLSLRAVAAKRLTLGAAVFDEPLGVEALSPNALGFDNEDGLIGSSILRQFTVYLDYGSNRVYFTSPPRQQTAQRARGVDAQTRSW